MIKRKEKEDRFCMQTKKTKSLLFMSLKLSNKSNKNVTQHCFLTEDDKKRGKNLVKCQRCHVKTKNP
jgi:hypothetical protein